MNVVKELGIREFYFTPRPNPIPGDRRLEWRSGVLLLVLGTISRAKTASLMKLHLFNWGLRTPEIRDKLVTILKGQVEPTTVIVRFDPGLTRVLAFLEALDLIERLQGAKYRLTKTGEQAVSVLLGQKELFVEEKKVLSSFSVNQASETVISGLFSRSFIL